MRARVARARRTVRAPRSRRIARRIDDLNVYPVPDGDTGTNLTLTVRAIAEALAGDGAGRPRRARAGGLARRADGRAGQLRRHPLADRARRAESLARVDDLARALPLGERRRLPRRQEAGRGDDADGDPRAGRGGRGASAISPPEIVRGRRRDAWCATPRDAARAARGRRRRRRRRRARRDRARDRRRAHGRAAARAPPELEEALGHRGDPPGALAFRYCTVFVVEGDDLDRARSSGARAARRLAARRRRPRPRSRCTCTPTIPGRALSLGVARGAIAGVEIANMHAQTPQREERLLHAVPDGAGACRASSPSPPAPATGAVREPRRASSSTAARR